MTYRIDVPGAGSNDVVTASVLGNRLSVTMNGRVLSRDEFRLSCDHEHDTAGCPACLLRNDGPALGERLNDLSRGVDMQPPRGSWAAATTTRRRR